MVTLFEMVEAEMDNLLANVAEDRRLIIQTLLEIRETVLNTLEIINGELDAMGVDPTKSTNEKEW